MEQLWRATRYDQISDEEPNLAAHWMMGCTIVCSPQMRGGDQIWRQTTFSQVLNYHLQSLNHCLMTTVNHSTRSVTKSLAQWCQRRSQYRWRAEWRRGADVLKDTGLTWWPWLGPVPRGGWDLFLGVGGGTCSPVYATVIDLLLSWQNCLLKLWQKNRKGWTFHRVLEE